MSEFYTFGRQFRELLQGLLELPELQPSDVLVGKVIPQSGGFRVEFDPKQIDKVQQELIAQATAQQKPGGPIRGINVKLGQNPGGQSDARSPSFQNDFKKIGEQEVLNKLKALFPQGISTEMERKVEIKVGVKFGDPVEIIVTIRF